MNIGLDFWKIKENGTVQDYYSDLMGALEDYKKEKKKVISAMRIWGDDYQLRDKRLNKLLDILMEKMIISQEDLERIME